jgi:hypothetical protein
MQLGFGTTGQLGNAGPHVQVAQQIAQALTGHNRSEKMPDGKRPIVICRGVCEEAKDMEAAQSLAEAKAHEMNADAYILKPVKRVAPKRDVVTTDLP